MLAERLITHGKQVFTTREPGGTPDAELIRSLLVSGDTTRWTSEEEILLVSVARSNHLRNIIRPKLEQGIFVICDRFIDSTFVYQCYAGNAKFEYFSSVTTGILDQNWPDLTIVLDLDPAIGIPRSRNRMANLKIVSEEALTQGLQTNDFKLFDVGHSLSTAASEDRFERKLFDFHKKVQAGFREVVNGNPQRCKLLDASRSPAVVADDVWKLINVS